MQRVDISAPLRAASSAPSPPDTDGAAPAHRIPARALLELLKPITWFPPMWAFACGAVSTGTPLMDRPFALIAGIVLVGPGVCGASQIANDWFDRHVDAINEPGRPIPSGRVPGRWGLYYAVFWSLLALLFSSVLGARVVAATALALALAWAYSAPPVRLKQNGWYGNAAVGLSYEGLAWVTGAVLMLGGTLPGGSVLVVAALYSLGAHGIMTLNDFKSIEGDRRIGIRSLPAQFGAARAARLACAVMALAQLAVSGCLLAWGHAFAAAGVAGSLAVQALAMRRMLRDPLGLAPWYNGVGVTLYVLGMLLTAAALGAGPA